MRNTADPRFEPRPEGGPAAETAHPAGPLPGVDPAAATPGFDTDTAVGTAPAPGGDPAAWYAERIACLAPFMTPERYDLFRRTAALRTRYITVLSENMYHPQNAAALIRHCEAFGIQQLHTVETLCRFRPNAAVSRGTDRWVDLRRHASVGDALAALRGEGYRIVATTPRRGDATPEDFDIAAGPFALVFGTEHAGISDEVVASADAFLRIPMCGMVESLNVSASAAILLYLLSARVRAASDAWRLDPVEQAAVLCGWMRRSVRDADAILARRFGPPAGPESNSEPAPERAAEPASAPLSALASDNTASEPDPEP